MPVVRVSFYRGRSQEQKRRIAEEITDTIHRIAGSKREAINVIFDEVERENWFIGATSTAPAGASAD